MSLKTRVEYLYPKMAHRMVEAVARKEIFNPRVFNYDIVSWSYRDYCDHTVSKKPKIHMIYPGSIEKYYYSWERKQSIFNLDLKMRWDENMVASLARYLCEHPEALPYFIIKNAIDTIGLFMGARDFNANSVEALCKDKSLTSVMWSLDSYEFKYALYDAQLKFSLFANVLSRILDMGINLDEIKIVQVFSRDTYINSKGYPWYEGMIVDHFKRGDGMRFTKEELFSILSFETLSEFFTNVEKVAELGSLLNFTLGDIPALKTVKLGTVMTSTFDFDNDTGDIMDLGEENVIDISTVCKMMCEKLASVKEKSENEVLVRRIKRLNEALSNKKEDTVGPDYSSYKSEIDSLFDEIVGSVSKEKDSHLKSLIDILKSYGIKSDKIEEEKSSVAELAAKVQEIDQRLSVVENVVANLKNVLLQYMENGGSNPLDSLSSEQAAVLKGLSSEEIAELLHYVSEYKPSTMGARMRKINILKTLKIFTVSATLVGLLSSSSVIQPGDTHSFGNIGEENITYSQGDLDENHSSSESTVIDPARPKEQLEETIKLFEQIEESFKPYYCSIYDKYPMGTTSKSGFIIRYYLLKDGACVISLDTEKELQQFISEQGENIRNFTWKTAICSLGRDEIAQYIDSGTPVPAEYTTFFADYTPSLAIDFDNKKTFY